MQKISTLADVKTDLKAKHSQILHSSLTLYVLAERRPTPINPDWVDVGCLNKNGAVGMMAYLSPLDALLDAAVRNHGGARFEVQPFEAIDPRPFITSHDNWLTVYLAYGFAARGKSLVVGYRGHVQALTTCTHFHIPTETIDHFHLSFSDELIGYINAIHRSAGISDFGRIAEEQAETSLQQLNQQAKEAAGRIKQTVIGHDNISHCALYDPVEQQWCFAGFEDTPDLSLDRGD